MTTPSPVRTMLTLEVADTALHQVGGVQTHYRLMAPN